MTQPIKLAINPKPAPPIEEGKPQPNRFLAETFTELKLRIFAQNHARLHFLVRHRKDLFVNCEIKKKAELRLDLIRGGRTIMIIENHEIIINGDSSELVEFLRIFFKPTPNIKIDRKHPEVVKFMDAIKNLPDKDSLVD